MHICAVPAATTARRQWWTCDHCGQLWATRDGTWRMVPTEPNPEAHHA